MPITMTKADTDTQSDNKGYINKLIANETVQQHYKHNN